MKTLLRAAAVTVTASFLLAGCGGTDNIPAAKQSATPDANTQTAVPVPTGVKLTAYGTALKFGQPATIAYAPNDQRRTVLEMTVLSAVQGSISDLASYTLEDRTKASTPYYVQVRVRNVGQGDVGQTPVPLFLVDNRNTLISASSFTNAFAKCPSTALPTTFAPNADRTMCLMFLAPDHGTMTGISYRAVQEHAPILWTGAVTVPKSPTKKQTKKAS